MGATVAGFGGEVCKHRCMNGEDMRIREQLRKAFAPSARGN
jgi:hypothetical protein